MAASASFVALDLVDIIVPCFGTKRWLLTDSQGLHDQSFLSTKRPPTNVNFACRVDWSVKLQRFAATAEVKSSQGQLLFKGLAAKVSATGFGFLFLFILFLAAKVSTTASGFLFLLFIVFLAAKVSATIAKSRVTVVLTKAENTMSFWHEESPGPLEKPASYSS